MLKVSVIGHHFENRLWSVFWCSRAGGQTALWSGVEAVDDFSLNKYLM